MKHNEQMQKMREAVAQTTGQRHCAYCNQYRPLEGGRWRLTKTAKKWMCSRCVDIRRPK